LAAGSGRLASEERGRAGKGATGQEAKRPAPRADLVHVMREAIETLGVHFTSTEGAAARGGRSPLEMSATDWTKRYTRAPLALSGAGRMGPRRARRLA